MKVTIYPNSRGQMGSLVCSHEQLTSVPLIDHALVLLAHHLYIITSIQLLVYGIQVRPLLLIGTSNVILSQDSGPDEAAILSNIRNRPSIVDPHLAQSDPSGRLLNLTASFLWAILPRLFRTPTLSSVRDLGRLSERFVGQEGYTPGSVEGRWEGMFFVSDNLLSRLQRVVGPRLLMFSAYSCFC
jgi:hypothetical protein